MDERNFILELIEVYRSLPALWQVKSKTYSNKEEKNAQYEILLNKYKEKYPNAGKKDVAQKINSLRTAYRRELKRMEKLEKSGAGAVEESEPNLYYFDAIDFLRDNELPCASQGSIDDTNETMNLEQSNKGRKSDPAAELMILAAERLKQQPDEYGKIVEGWAVKLKNMNPTQRIYADKFINEILFEGQMGTLHRNSMQLNSLRPSSEHSCTPTPPTSSSSSDGSFIGSSVPVFQVPLPLFSPQIQNVETIQSTDNSIRSDETTGNSLPRYFSSFQ